MSQFDEHTFSKLAKLSRIQCSEEEQKKLLNNLQRILSYIEQLKEVPTEGIMPCNHVLETLSNVMREDAVGATLSREAFLENAPSQVGGMVRVPPIIKFSNP